MKEKVLLIALIGISTSFCTGGYSAETELLRHQVYGHRDGMAMFYDVEIPPDPNGLGIVLVVSGGWVSGEDNLNLSKPFWDVLLDEGYTLFEIYHPAIPSYRIPDAFNALQAGVRHIQENGAKFGVDTDRLGVIGISSGGHLALLLGMSVNPEERSSSDFNAVVALMPIVDIRDLDPDAELFGARYLDIDQELIPEVSPVDHVTADDPPTLLIHGTRDRAVNYEKNSLRLQSLLEANGVENALLPVDADHEVFPEPYLGQAHTAILDWFSEHL